MNAALKSGKGSADKWLIAASVMFGTFLAVMDVSVVNVALPHMMGTFGEDLSAITWVATSYSIAEIILATMAGWWSTLIGRKRLYLASFVLFTCGSMLAGTARTFTQMLVYRTIQGVGGGALIPVSQAILRESFPEEEQGTAMSLYGMGVVLAPALGPVVGGWLTDHYGWPWIFYINIPFSIIGILMVSSFVKDPPYLRRELRRIDWVGIGLLGLGLTGMQIVLERGERENWFESNLITFGAVATVIVLAILVFYELRSSEPVVNFRILKDIPLSVGSGMGLLFGIGLYGTTFLLPQFLQNLMGYDAFQAGLVLLPRSIALFFIMPLAGRLYNYIDSRLLISFGIGILFISYLQLSSLTTSVGFWNLVPMLVIMGIGMPFMFVTLTTVSLSTVDRRNMTEATSIYTLTRRVGGNIGYAVLATLVDRRAQFHRVRLVHNVSPLNPNFSAVHGAISRALGAHGTDAASAPAQALSVIDHIINRQSLMMAYNDASWLLAVMFVCAIPLVFLFPSRRKQLQALKRRSAAGGH